jgi:hypothetical protein
MSRPRELCVTVKKKKEIYLPWDLIFLFQLADVGQIFK